jgi:hypothetical protein
MRNLRQLTAILVGSITFGVLMALRFEAKGVLSRAFIAAAAGAILSTAMIAARAWRKNP